MRDHLAHARCAGNSPPPISSRVEAAWWTLEASACILLSAKVNEVPRKVRDVVNVAHQVMRFRVELLSGVRAKQFYARASVLKRVGVPHRGACNLAIFVCHGLPATAGN